MNNLERGSIFFLGGEEGSRAYYAGSLPYDSKVGAGNGQERQRGEGLPLQPQLSLLGSPQRTGQGLRVKGKRSCCCFAGNSALFAGFVVGCICILWAAITQAVAHTSKEGKKETKIKGTALFCGSPHLSRGLYCAEGLASVRSDGHQINAGVMKASHGKTLRFFLCRFAPYLWCVLSMLLRAAKVTGDRLENFIRGQRLRG